jgi:hypothetical protein
MHCYFKAPPTGQTMSIDLTRIFRQPPLKQFDLPPGRSARSRYLPPQRPALLDDMENTPVATDLVRWPRAW